MGSGFKMWQEGIYMFKKAFWVPYEDSGNYPTVTKAKEAIAAYCGENGYSYTFTADDEVMIDGKFMKSIADTKMEAGETMGLNVRKNRM